MQSKFCIYGKLIGIFFSIFILSGCKDSVPTPQKPVVATPSWVNEIPPPDTARKMYGIAIEKNRDLAIKSALADMISKFSISIESSYNSDQKVINNAYSKLVVTNNIKADIAKIKINNYKIEKSHRLNYREFAVLISTDKKQFKKGLNDELKLKMKVIKDEYKALEKRDALSRYNGKKKLAQNAKDLIPRILILKEFNSTLNAQEFVLQKQREFLIEKNSLKFYINGDKNSLVFIRKIKNYLLQQGFTVTNVKTGAVRVMIKTEKNISTRGIEIAVLKLDIAVYDKNQRIGGKVKILKERYNGSMSSVYKNAAIHLEQDIKTEGIKNVIGIEL